MSLMASGIPPLVAAAVVLDAGDVGVDVRAQALRADIIHREARHARGGLLFVAAAALKGHGHEERAEEQHCLRGRRHGYTVPTPSWGWTREDARAARPMGEAWAVVA